MKLHAFHPVEGGDEGLKKNIFEEPLYLEMFVIQHPEFVSVDSDQCCILHCLNTFPGWGAGDQALDPGDKCIFKFETFRHVLVTFQVINPQASLFNKIDSPAGMADWLYICIFFVRNYFADFQ